MPWSMVALVLLGLAWGGAAAADEFVPAYPGRVSTRGWVQVPAVLGLGEAEARQALSRAGLQARVHHEGSPRRQCSDPTTAGLVTRQNPAPEQLQRRGGWVEISVCPGQAWERRATMPDLRGLTPAQARGVLAGLGMKARLERRQPCPQPEWAGRVVGQSLAAGEQARRGQVVVLRYCPGVQAPRPTGPLTVFP